MVGYLNYRAGYAPTGTVVLLHTALLSLIVPGLLQPYELCVWRSCAASL